MLEHELVGIGLLDREEPCLDREHEQLGGSQEAVGAEASHGLAPEPALLVGGEGPAALRRDRDAGRLAATEVLDQLGEGRDRIELGDRLELQPAFVDRAVDRRR